MSRSPLLRIAPAGYGLGLMLLVLPLSELLMGTWPPRPSMVNWRFAIAGLFANNLLLPTIGGAVLVTVAAGLGHRRVLRALASVALLASILEVTILLVFSLDSVQMRAMIQSEVKLGFDLAALKSLFSLFAGAAVLAAFGITGWRASRPGHAAESGEHRARETILLGSRSAPGAKGSLDTAH